MLLEVDGAIFPVRDCLHDLPLRQDPQPSAAHDTARFGSSRFQGWILVHWGDTPPRRCPCASFQRATARAQSAATSVACATGSMSSLATRSQNHRRLHQRLQRDSEKYPRTRPNCTGQAIHSTSRCTRSRTSHRRSHGLLAPVGCCTNGVLSRCH